MRFMSVFGSQYIGISSSGLSAISSAGDYYMEIAETSSGGRKTTIRKKTELAIREELQKETDEWLVGVV